MSKSENVEIKKTVASKEAKGETSCECNIVHADKVKDAAENMLMQTEVARLSEFFKMLGDGTRLKIVWALEKGELCVCDLAAVLGMTKSAVSHQLAYLRELAIVKPRKEGKSVYYSLDDDHVKYVIDIALDHTRHTSGKK